MNQICFIVWFVLTRMSFILDKQYKKYRESDTTSASVNLYNIYYDCLKVEGTLFIVQAGGDTHFSFYPYCHLV